jgi:predicted nucleic acid-binding protein
VSSRLGPATLVDSDVLLDLITEDPQWFRWSSDALAAAADRGPLVINPIVYAEVSVGFSRIEELDAVLSPDDFVRAPLPWPAAFLAAKCFRDYKRRGGSKASVLPDFLIGAHAAIDRIAVLSRDAKRYRTYFPTVALIVPDGQM